MTIAAGFNCSDGILLASDTLYSGPGRKSGRKLWVVSKTDPVVVFGGAGNEGPLRRTRDEIERRISNGMNRDDVVDAIDEALMVVAGKITHEDRVPEGLFVIRTGSDNQLYENSCGATVLSTVDHPSLCVGADAGIAQFFSRFLFRPDMTMAWAKIVASQAVKNAKQYGDESGCDTNLLEIPDQGDVRFIDNQTEISGMERRLDVVLEALRIVLPDGSANDEALRQRLSELVGIITNLRRVIAVSVPAGHASAIGGVPGVEVFGPPPVPPKRE